MKARCIFNRNGTATDETDCNAYQGYRCLSSVIVTHKNSKEPVNEGGFIYQLFLTLHFKHDLHGIDFKGCLSIFCIVYFSVSEPLPKSQIKTPMPGRLIFDCRLFIEFRIDGIEILAVQVILNNSECFTESLEMRNLARPQVADRIDYIRIIYHS